MIKKYQSILLDAPCSALGTFRRNPDVITKIEDKKIQNNHKIQFEMIEKSLNLLNKEGILVYIVCSFHPFETMGVIDKVTQKHKNISLLNIQSDKMIKKEMATLSIPSHSVNLVGLIFFL